ncbi:pyrimidine-nucleoside phosphorylase [Clostridium tertium]|jgi:pyrimidine-nucleoside phosphorylase|uniref:pyrimidine-nucleoside phosphorylase n=2 Tax=Clostridiaceae TaxID=31979 RepID=UPI00019B05BC|nr:MULTISPECIES: pyrimidine-nucleoside phosphorylase [Clostridium]EEH99259.1 pyrimidine-nucleoside phosphorylase [Clostridium sp. 7_2_43FAA]MBS6501940.1 pyrimidine-nucleoside phosphorylase [Clostridium sp.]MBU6137198.1 pyrimidine-nucleoside phosphorylase [Clostridium tertium]MDB1956939.1 pyrimidine-nucleoside phosphorylase [Clostridium tertium]MDB1960132.1 pyrimidine-nucleoside phosphorylase [Clostridium tertium]
MRAFDIIAKKRDKKELSKEEIEFFIEGYTKGEVTDYQTSALLMAIYLNGFSKEETVNLTMAMIKSGDVVDLSEINGIKVDKHSTGGVGDKTSLILVPMVAAAGGKVAKLSGRGLGHTGGTLDKLEAIPGFDINVSKENFINFVNKSGLVIAGQTQNIVPADKKIYALRDVTATIDSIPLIAASIMSKKIASGSDAILLDVKYGDGAFMKTKEDAEKLAEAMVSIGKGLNRNTSAAITLNGEPLGYAIGNALEIQEVIEVLSDRGPEDLRELCLRLGAQMLKLSNIEVDVNKGRAILEEVLKNGKALEKLKELVANQGGDVSVIEDKNLFTIAEIAHEVKAQEEGYVYELNAEKVGIASLLAGAGRETKDDVIDYGAGIILSKKMGSYVNKGDILATIYTSDMSRIEKSEEMLLSAYTMSNEKPAKVDIIHKIIE